MILGEKLSLLRKQNGYSQEELADKLHIARQAVSKWENGLAVPELDGLISFLIKAKQKTYAGHGAEVAPSRPASHDLKYEEKTPAGTLLYIDTYLGGKDFAGEEAIWRNGTPLWSMNYYGRVTGEPFSGDFLKAALFEVPADKPYRGPDIFRQGDYTYHCQTNGDFEWFQGYEDIFYLETKIYELHFHGGIIV